MNLHSLWDTALLEPEKGTPAEIAARIDGAVTNDFRTQWQGSTREQSALESLAIVRTKCVVSSTGDINRVTLNQQGL